MTLKERVKNLCKNRGVSMNQLEKELEFASGYISKLDKSTPNSKNIQKIANYFNVSVDYIMTGKETVNASLPFVGAILLIILSMDHYLLQVLH